MAPLVGLNLVFLVPGETGGMEIYARELIARLAERDDVRLVAFVNRETAGSGWPEIPARVVPVHARNRVQWVRGEQQYLPRLAAREGCDIVHSLASTAPLYGSFRRVTTLHDLNYKLVPEAHFGVNALGMRVLVPAAARRSHRLITAAQASRDEIVEHLHIAPEKIDVVPHGFGHDAGAAHAPEAELRAELELGDRQVVLSASAKRPHKNLLRLIEALARFGADERPVLVLPGYPTPHEDELRARAAALGVEGDVRFVGWIGSAELEGLYALADAFVFPSLSEGFGLPVLEAMARGVPVACSDRSTMPEVAGDAALLFDPEDVGAIAEATRRLLTDGALAARLREAGRERAAQFTWERAAEQTVASYRRAL